MTLHTRVMVTSPGVDMREAFDKMRELIGADGRYRFWQSPELDSDNEYRHTMPNGWHMNLGQGLPALMWVEEEDGTPETCDPDWCDEDCSGKYHNPAGWLQIHFDTAYAYRADNDASCSDLHAWLVREIGAWLSERGATWIWFDESGDGWQQDLSSYGTLGDPEVGQIGSAVRRTTTDSKRAFGALALAAVASRFTEDGAR